MRHIGIFALVLFLFLSGCSRSENQGQVVDLEVRAEDFIGLISRGKYDEARNLCDSRMAASLTAQSLQELWSGLVSQLGAFKSVTKTRLAEESGYNVVYTTCLFEKSIMDIKVVFDRKAQVAGFWLGDPQTTQYKPPLYAKEDSFAEQEVTVGAEDWPLPGTLTLPKGEGPFPAVVLIHGSGPNDRDESLGPNKPFKDLAWGLASKGIAVLRYDKRTKVHAQKLGQMASRFTVKEEVIDDALAAVNSLMKTDGIDPQRIVLIGHSLGGTLIPRIAKDALDQGLPLAGIVSMAGSPRQIIDLVVEQLEYIAEADGNVDETESQAIEAAKNQVAKIKAGNQGSAEMLLGAPRKYWDDLLAYDALSTAKELTLPMLFLQGERDYQVLLSKDFQMWKDGLSSKSNVIFKSYSDLNHLFIAGSGPSVPDEYQIPSNVHSAVIDDIASFIEGLGKPMSK